MGFFSWCTSDTKKSINNIYSGKTFPVYVLTPDGEPIREDYYSGYGRFGGYDIYELVAEWNKNHISDNILSRMEPRQIDIINAFRNDAPNELLKNFYGKEWKREIGILIACHDESNFSLEFPIKIVEKPVDYKKAMPSISCPWQGYFYEYNVGDPREKKSILLRERDVEAAVSKRRK